jgi:hypothetical protein
MVDHDWGARRDECNLLGSAESELSLSQLKRISPHAHPAARVGRIRCLPFTSSISTGYQRQYPELLRSFKQTPLPSLMFLISVADGAAITSWLFGSGGRYFYCESPLRPDFGTRKSPPPSPGHPHTKNESWPALSLGGASRVFVSVATNPRQRAIHPTCFA